MVRPAKLILLLVCFLLLAGRAAAAPYCFELAYGSSALIFQFDLSDLDAVANTVPGDPVLYTAPFWQMGQQDDGTTEVFCHDDRPHGTINYMPGDKEFGLNFDAATIDKGGKKFLRHLLCVFDNATGEGSAEFTWFRDPPVKQVYGLPVMNIERDDYPDVTFSKVACPEPEMNCP